MQTSRAHTICRARSAWLGLLAFLVACGSLAVQRPTPAVASQTAWDARFSAPVTFTRFGSAESFGVGAFAAVELSGDTLTLAPGALSGTWTSPAVEPGSPFTQLVSSWNAETPAESWIRVDAQPIVETVGPTRWYSLGIWAQDDHTIQRTSVDGQTDQDARVATDTLIAREQPFTGYRLRVTLERSNPEAPPPMLRMLGAVVSDESAFQVQGVSQPSDSGAIELPVPAYSQETHAGHYPHWAGGGEAWCSPTSTQMVVEYWGRGPSADELAWVEPGHADPSVDFAARATYDAAYRGTGNWSFNTAYAGLYGLEAFVTRLRSLAEAEQFIRAGMPLVVSIKSGPGELDGFLFWGGTNGHLVVVVGFDDAGNPIVNDPAAWSNAGVRRVYDRAQFEHAWLRGSGGLTYLIRPPEIPLPPHPAGVTLNW